MLCANCVEYWCNKFGTMETRKYSRFPITVTSNELFLQQCVQIVPSRRVNDAQSYSMPWPWKDYYHMCSVRANLQIYKPWYPIVTMVQRNPTITAITITQITPDSKVHGANMGPIWGRQDPGGPRIGPMNFAIWDVCVEHRWIYFLVEWPSALAWIIPLQQTSPAIHLMIDRYYWYNLYRLTIINE